MERDVIDERELDEAHDAPRGPAPTFEETDASFLVELTGIVVNEEIGESLGASDPVAYDSSIKRSGRW
jgi:hypothetical protein